MSATGGSVWHVTAQVTNEATHGDAFDMSSTGTPDPLTIRDVTSTLAGVKHLAEVDGELWPAAALAGALHDLRGDLTRQGRGVLDHAITEWHAYFARIWGDAPPPALTPRMVAWIAAAFPPLAGIARRLLTHLTAYRARLNCGPQRLRVCNYDATGETRVRPTRRSRWDGMRSLDEDHPGRIAGAVAWRRARRRIQRRLDLAETRAARGDQPVRYPSSGPMPMPAPSRAFRRAEAQARRRGAELAWSTWQTLAVSRALSLAGSALSRAATDPHRLRVVAGPRVAHGPPSAPPFAQALSPRDRAGHVFVVSCQRDSAAFVA